MGEDVSDIGEFALIRRLVERLPPGEGVVLGPGDDAAVLAAPDGPTLLATADLLVEGRHFDLAFSSPADVGFKALTVNVSDIAAMGGRPRFALVSLGAGPATPVALLESLYDGLAEAARAYGVAVAGGDTVASETLLISVAVLGETEGTGPVRREGARAGDVLCVTGELGAAGAGLALLRAAGTDPMARALLERFPNLAEAHRRGRARIAEGRAAARGGARAMIDISDGLGADVAHICEASGVGVEIAPSAVPIARGVDEAAVWAGEEPGRFALEGGDDYELAIAISPELVDTLAAAVAPTPLARAGRFVEDATMRPSGGWDHFT